MSNISPELLEPAHTGLVTQCFVSLARHLSQINGDAIEANHEYDAFIDRQFYYADDGAQENHAYFSNWVGEEGSAFLPNIPYIPMMVLGNLIS
jgi:hypothetical protein